MRDSTNPSAQEQAVRRLMNYELDSEIIDGLISLLGQDTPSDSGHRVNKRATVALAHAGEFVRTTLQAVVLGKTASSPNDWQRYWACKVMEIHRDKAWLPLLIELIRSEPSGTVTEGAIDAAMCIVNAEATQEEKSLLMDSLLSARKRHGSKQDWTSGLITRSMKRLAGAAGSGL